LEASPHSFRALLELPGLEPLELGLPELEPPLSQLLLRSE